VGNRRINVTEESNSKFMKRLKRLVKELYRENLYSPWTDMALQDEKISLGEQIGYPRIDCTT
jgi:hypothetical protein